MDVVLTTISMQTSTNYMAELTHIYSVKYELIIVFDFTYQQDKILNENTYIFLYINTGIQFYMVIHAGYDVD